jgi:hypothetical protein
LTVALCAACSDGEPADNGRATDAAPSPRDTTASPAARPPSSLIYLRENTLVSLDLDDGSKEELGTFPSQDVFAYGEDFVVVEDRGRGDDFAERPVLTIRDVSGAMVDSFGSGFSPLVGHHGAVAFLRPSTERVCEGETCVGGIQVMVGDGTGSTPRRLLPPGDWGLLAWAGENLLVADGQQPETALLVGPTGEVQALPVAPNEIWDSSGSIAIVVEERVATMDLATGAKTVLEIGGSLADGIVIGDEALAVELGRRSSRLVSISLEDGRIERVPGSEGAMGPVLALPGGEAFAYARADGLAVEAVVCETSQTCSAVLRWAEGVTPLALR